MQSAGNVTGLYPLVIIKNIVITQRPILLRIYARDGEFAVNRAKTVDFFLKQSAAV